MLPDRNRRSRSISRGRLRRSPWSPRRRRSRDRSLSLTRSPSPRRRHRSPMRYRTPLRSPLRSPPRSSPRSPLRSPPRSPHRSPPRSPHRTPHRSPRRSPLRSPMRSPRRSAMRSPPPRAMSPHRYPGLYDELLSPPRRNVEPPYGPRFGPRNNAPPPVYPNMGVKPIPPLSSIPIQEPPPGYRGRYDGPPFEDIPPGLEPAVPGFEPSPFEKPPYAPPGPIDRERIPPSNYRDPYRAPFVEGPPGYRDMPMPPVQNEIPVHVGDPPRYRDNYRPGNPYRDQGPIPYREGQPFREVGQPIPYRDPGFRGGPPAPFRENYRNAPFREGGFRDNPPHGFREGPVPFRPPSVDPREPPPANYHDPAFRDGFRDESNPSREMRPGYNRPGIRNRGPSRRNPNFEQERHREQDGRDRERFGENRDPADRARDMEKRSGYEKGRDNREGREDRPREDRSREERSRSDRPRDHERNREYDKEREHERVTPDKKNRGSPKRNRDMREKRRSESRGRSRDRDGKRDKKEERLRDKTSSERTKEHKDKEKKLRDRKKKKREKEKDTDKKKKREKKDKKDKENIKREDDETEKSESKEDEMKESNKADTDTMVDENKASAVGGNNMVERLGLPKAEVKDEPKNDLYGDEPAETVDKEIIQNYVKAEENENAKEEVNENSNVDPGIKEEPFDGIELQVTADELDLKADIESTTEREMLAPLPELSKWEVDDDNAEKKEPGEITSPEEEDSGKVTSEVLKRAENAIFAKAINSLRPIEIKKISSDRLKLYDDANQSKGSMNNIQITVPVADPEQRSIEINDKNKKRTSKTPPPRLSVKERLGGKVDDLRRSREPRVVQSTVERVKSRSKTPKKELSYRRVTVDRDRGKKLDSLNSLDQSKEEKPRLIADARGLQEKFSSRSPNRSDRKRKDMEKSSKEPKKIRSEANVDSRAHDKSTSLSQKTISTERERKKSTLDEAHFEPDYDETVESDHEGKDESSGKKRERSLSETVPGDVKKPKLEDETIKLDLTNVKKKPDTETESSSDSSSSSSSSDARKRKKKKKRSSKKKKKRAASDSESESDSDSDDHKKKKKKRKHKKKSSKKKKKSKHK